MSAEPQTPDPSESHAIGAAFGAWSGRAVAVRVSDGEERRTAVLEHPPAVMDRVLTPTGRRLPPDGALEAPAGFVTGVGASGDVDFIEQGATEEVAA